MYRGYEMFSLLLAAFLLMLAGRPAMAIEYEVEPCCNICPAAEQLESYNSSYLRLFKTLIEGEDGWLFRTEAELGTEFGPDDVALKELYRFAQTLRLKGTELVLVYQPTRGLVHPMKASAGGYDGFDYQLAASNYRRALERFRSIGIYTPDLTPLLNQPVGEDNYYFRRDHHWTPAGARMTAKLVADSLRLHPLYPDLEKLDFETKRIGMMLKRGSLQVAHATLCKNSYANQYVDEYFTEPMEEGDLFSDEEEDDSLFGDDSLPEVTLVGTSFSKGAANYNFDGFLKEYLHLDILNEAVAGGSYDGTLIQYLPSEEFQQSPPRMMIWEVPSYHDLSTMQFYRQVIPMVYDGCKNQPAVLQKTMEVKAGDQEILFNGGGQYQDLRGGDYLVDLQFSDPQLKHIELSFWYINRRRDRLRLEHGDRVNGRGRFVVELKSEEEWADYHFLSLDLNLPEGVESVNLTATMCRRPDDMRVAGK